MGYSENPCMDKIHQLSKGADRALLSVDFSNDFDYAVRRYGPKMGPITDEQAEGILKYLSLRWGSETLELSMKAQRQGRHRGFSEDYRRAVAQYVNGEDIIPDEAIRNVVEELRGKWGNVDDSSWMGF